MSTPMTKLECATSVRWHAGRPYVECEVLHFVASGLAVADLIALVRPQLETAVREAAALAVEPTAARRKLALGVDIGEADPDIIITVHAPAAVLADLEDHLQRLLVGIPQYVASSTGTGGAV